ncbi:hypothetical protein RF11_14475 [Thelohanellus kitauei]|uniref:Uncharacterized protein n=1 Tax=Thelohanellus kitauei TaxID=669202 RepID=A0A0C2JAW5_THEKT|nr:hypothetical protein RF11_14475 [Thelohanellus kitauei]
MLLQLPDFSDVAQERYVDIPLEISRIMSPSAKRSIRIVQDFLIDPTVSTLDGCCTGFFFWVRVSVFLRSRSAEDLEEEHRSDADAYSAALEFLELFGARELEGR